MILRPHQERALRLIRPEIMRGGSMVIITPTGMGRSIVIAHSVRESPLKFAFVTKRPELKFQFEEICKRSNVQNIDFFLYRKLPKDLSSYDRIICDETMVEIAIKHDHVIRNM